MKRTCLLFVSVVIYCLNASAQMPCGNDLLEKNKEKKSFFAQQKAKEKQAWLKYNRALALSKTIVSGTDTSYEIPVAVHVIHTGGVIGSKFNPSDAAIDSLLNYLNLTYAAQWSSYADTFSGGTRVPIKFARAKRAPDCSATTGINRVNGAVLSGYAVNGICPFGMVSGPSDSAVKRLSLWPTRDYYNIWLVNTIENGMVGGYAPWPWYTEADFIDGAVFLAEYAKPVAGSEYYIAAPHEIGHSFGLYHTFQDGCGTGTDCLTEGDQLCDTEPHEFDGMDCDEGNLNDCTGAIFAGVEHNIMNYSSCPNRFTKDQRKRMLYTLKGYRMGLVNSLGATAPDASFVIPLSACKPSIVNAGNSDNNGPCTISFADMVTSSSGFRGDGHIAYLDRTCSQQAASVVLGTSYNISVETKGFPQNVKVWIDYNNDGTFQVTEMVFAHTGTMPEELHTGTIAIPASAVVTKKNLRMRVKADNLIITDACSNVMNGQTEDYTVLVKESTSIPGIALAENTFRIYPNPSQSNITVETAVAAVFTIFSIDGKKVLEEQDKNQIDISQLAAGVYFINAFDKADGRFIGAQKLLKMQP